MAKIAVQLVHHGKISRVDVASGDPVYVPSLPEWHGSLDMINDLSIDELMAWRPPGGADMKPQFHAMTTDEIAAITEQLGDAVVRAQRPGSTPSRFTAPTAISSPGCRASGTGDDEYGGPIENRARFLCEVVTSEIAHRWRFPGLGAPRCARVPNPDGITFDECEITARLAVEAGADAIHLSAYGDMTSGQAFTDGDPRSGGEHSALSGRLTEALPVPVIAIRLIQPTPAIR